MSDNKPNDTDPMLEHLLRRRDLLFAEIRERQTRLSEVDEMIEVLTDGRSRVSKQRRQRATGNSSAADGEKPQPSFLRPDAAEQETA
jgi:hypothetical protein